MPAGQEGAGFEEVPLGVALAGRDLVQGGDRGCRETAAVEEGESPALHLARRQGFPVELAAGALSGTGKRAQVIQVAGDGQGGGGERRLDQQPAPGLAEDREVMVRRADLPGEILQTGRGIPLDPVPASGGDQLQSVGNLILPTGEIRRGDIGLAAERRPRAAGEEIRVGPPGELPLAAGDGARREEVETPVLELPTGGGARRQELLGVQEIVRLIGVEPGDQAGARRFDGVFPAYFLQKLARALQIFFAQGLGGSGITGGSEGAGTLGHSTSCRPARFQVFELAAVGDALEKPRGEQGGDEQDRSDVERAW